MDEVNIIEMYNDGINSIITLVGNLNSKIDSFSLEITELKDLSFRQEQRILELEIMINKNSNNSSKPPSSDVYKKTIKNNRKKTGRSTGGQIGHKGSTLEKAKNPDEIIELNSIETCDCGCSLEGVKGVKKTRQVFDIPTPKIFVKEFTTNEKVCPDCRKVHKTEFPEGVTQPTQYGENMQSLMNYLTQYQLIPLERAAEAIGDITGQKISQGTLVNAAITLSNSLKDTVNEIKNKIKNSEVVHFDETGMRSNGKTEWMHAAVTETLTYYEIHQNRGEKAMTDIGILPNFAGTAVHDHWKPYYCFEQCTHSECNSHHLRYLKSIYEDYHQDWANTMSSLLIEINRKVESLKVQNLTEMPKEDLEKWHKLYHAIIENGIEENSQKSPVILNKKGKPIKSKSLQLLMKLQKYDIETLAFMYDFNIPFDNNLAERSIRMQKLRQKISGCFRGKNGGNIFCRIRSYISTAKKNKINAMEAISTAVKGHPFVPV